MPHTAIPAIALAADVALLHGSSFLTAVVTTESGTVYTIVKRSGGNSITRVSTFGYIDVLTDVSMAVDFHDRLHVEDADTGRMLVRSTSIVSVHVIEN